MKEHICNSFKQAIENQSMKNKNNWKKKLKYDRENFKYEHKIYIVIL